MSTIRIPLVGSFNQRGLDGNIALTDNQDQRFLNCIFDVVHNPVTDKLTVYVEKRPGWSTDTIVSDGNPSTGVIKPFSFAATLSAFGATNSTIYIGSTSVGAITGRGLHYTETVISSVNYVVIKSSDGTAWYYANGAKDVTAYTADGNNSTTITDIKIAGANSTAGLYPGQLLTASANIVAGTRIVSVNSGAFTAVLDTATVDGAFNDLAITKTPIAKILDTDFITTGTQQSAFVEMDGYLFYCVNSGNLYNSDLNSITSYTSTNFLTPNMSPDQPIAVARQKNGVIVLGNSSKEVFYNVGNVSGSPLQRVPQYFDRIGTIDQRSVTTLNDEIYFVASPSSGEIGVYEIKNFQTNRISTPHTDRILGNISTTGGAIYANSFKMGGYSYVGFFATTATDSNASNLLLESGDALLLEDGDNLLLEENVAQAASFHRYLVYNVDLKLWSEWDCQQPTFVSSVTSGTSNIIIATSRVLTTGKIYSISPAISGKVYTDDGTAYTMEIRTSKMDLGTSKRKRIKSIRLICDAFSASDGPPGATGTCTLEWSDDDYVTWSTPRTFDLTSREPKLSACGSHKGYRAYRLKHSGNMPFRAEALEIEYESEANKIPGKA